MAVGNKHRSVEPDGLEQRHSNDCPHLPAAQAGGTWREERGQRLEGLLRAILLYKRHLGCSDRDNQGLPCESSIYDAVHTTTLHRTSMFRCK